MSWNEIELADVCEIGRGSSPRPINNKAYFEGGEIPWIKIADATNSFKVIFKTKEYVNSYGASFSRLLPVDSLIVAASGTLGFPMFLGVEGCIHDGWLYFKSYNGIDKNFLYYKIIDLNKYFYSKAYGAAIQNINTDTLRRTKINLPPLPTQKRIASILSTYDDLIENNLKRIKLLEETAQNIYKEWFVNFRFPNYENTPFNEETGLPVGWEKTKIGNYCKIGRGSSPRPIKDERFFIEGKIPWIKIADATSSTIFISKTNQYINEFGASFSRQLTRGSIILAASGTLGFPMILGVDACIHDGWIYIYDYDEKMKYFQYYQFKSLTEYFYSISYGAAIQNINTGIVSNAPVILPTIHLLHKFNDTIEPIFNNIEILQNQNQKLKEARDILLPRLMNRTIEV